jgi:hypothetical protein
MIVDGKEIYPTSSESMSMTCPKCGDEGRRHVWVNTVVRAVQIKEVCFSCDYEKFEPWEVVEESYQPKLNQKADEPHRRACVGCNECESKDQRATVAPAKKVLRRDSLPVRLDDWHRAFGFHKCATCGAPIGNGIRHVWQGRNRWCEECFWGDDSQSAISDVPIDFDAPEKENADVDH